MSNTKDFRRWDDRVVVVSLVVVVVVVEVAKVVMDVVGVVMARWFCRGKGRK